MPRFSHITFSPMQIGLCLFYIAIALLTINACVHYAGQTYIYLLFALISNALLYFGFNKKALFFDAFIGIFFWLGFWLKLTIRVGFTEGVFFEHTGKFDGSGAAFDRGLLVASCGMGALIVATLIRRRFFYLKEEPKSSIGLPGLFDFYKKNRTLVLIAFVILVLFISLSNLYLGIYQRGQVARTVLPYGLGGVYKWLLLFGMASFIAVILRFECLISNNKPYVVSILSVLESFASNVSLLSRGMILNMSALFYGLFKDSKARGSTKFSLRFVVTMALVFGLLFVSSVYIVNYLRFHGPEIFGQTWGSSEEGESLARANSAAVRSMATPLFIDRWVGMEGVFAVSSSDKTGDELWHQAWQEVYRGYGTSFYDLNLIQSSYLEIDTSKHHFISLPGVIAFCFYPGSFGFLFGALLLVGFIGAAIEIFVYQFGGRNLILCSLLGQVVAFRFASFGYVPTQSYLLFGTLFLNVMLIYSLNKVLLFKYRHSF